MTKQRKQKENLDWEGLHAFLRDAYDAGRTDGEGEPIYIDGSDYAKRVCDLFEQIQDGTLSSADAAALVDRMLDQAN